MPIKKTLKTSFLSYQKNCGAGNEFGTRERGFIEALKIAGEVKKVKERR